MSPALRIQRVTKSATACPQPSPSSAHFLVYSQSRQQSANRQFLKEYAILNKGPLRLKNLIWFIRIAKASIRAVPGKNENELAQFLRLFPNVFVINKDIVDLKLIQSANAVIVELRRNYRLARMSAKANELVYIDKINLESRAELNVYRDVHVGDKVLVEVVGLDPRETEIEHDPFPVWKAIGLQRMHQGDLNMDSKVSNTTTNSKQEQIGNDSITPSTDKTSPTMTTPEPHDEIRDVTKLSDQKCFPNLKDIPNSTESPHKSSQNTAVKTKVGPTSIITKTSIDSGNYFTNEGTHHLHEPNIAEKLIKEGPVGAVREGCIYATEQNKTQHSERADSYRHIEKKKDVAKLSVNAPLNGKGDSRTSTSTKEVKQISMDFTPLLGSLCSQPDQAKQNSCHDHKPTTQISHPSGAKKQSLSKDQFRNCISQIRSLLQTHGPLDIDSLYTKLPTSIQALIDHNADGLMTFIYSTDNAFIVDQNKTISVNALSQTSAKIHTVVHWIGVFAKLANREEVYINLKTIGDQKMNTLRGQTVIIDAFRLDCREVTSKSDRCSKWRATSFKITEAVNKPQIKPSQNLAKLSPDRVLPSKEGDHDTYKACIISTTETLKTQHVDQSSTHLTPESSSIRQSEGENIDPPTGSTEEVNMSTATQPMTEETQHDVTLTDQSSNVTSELDVDIEITPNDSHSADVLVNSGEPLTKTERPVNTDTDQSTAVAMMTPMPDDRFRICISQTRDLLQTHGPLGIDTLYNKLPSSIQSLIGHSADGLMTFINNTDNAFIVDQNRTISVNALSKTSAKIYKVIPGYFGLAKLFNGEEIFIKLKKIDQLREGQTVIIDAFRLGCREVTSISDRCRKWRATSFKITEAVIKPQILPFPNQAKLSPDRDSPSTEGDHDTYKACIISTPETLKTQHVDESSTHLTPESSSIRQSEGENIDPPTGSTEEVNMDTATQPVTEETQHDVTLTDQSSNVTSELDVDTEITPNGSHSADVLVNSGEPLAKTERPVNADTDQSTAVAMMTSMPDDRFRICISQTRDLLQTHGPLGIDTLYTKLPSSIQVLIGHNADGLMTFINNTDNAFLVDQNRTISVNALSQTCAKIHEVVDGNHEFAQLSNGEEVFISRDTAEGEITEVFAGGQNIIVDAFRQDRREVTSTTGRAAQWRATLSLSLDAASDGAGDAEGQGQSLVEASETSPHKDTRLNYGKQECSKSQHFKVMRKRLIESIIRSVDDVIGPDYFCNTSEAVSDISSAIVDTESIMSTAFDDDENNTHEAATKVKQVTSSHDSLNSQSYTECSQSIREPCPCACHIPSTKTQLSTSQSIHNNIRTSPLFCSCLTESDREVCSNVSTCNAREATDQPVINSAISGSGVLSASRSFAQTQTCDVETQTELTGYVVGSTLYM